MRSSNWLRLAGALALLLLLLASHGVLAQKKQLTPEQQVELQRIDSLYQQATKLLDQGEPARAAELLSEVSKRWEANIGFTKDLLVFWDSLITAAILAEDFEVASEVCERNLSVLTRTFGASDWRTRTAKRTLTEIVVRKEMSPAQRRELADSAKAMRHAMILLGKREFGQAIDLALRAKAGFERTPGKETGDYTTVLDNLAILYRAMGENGKAEPLIARRCRSEKGPLARSTPVTR